MRILTVHNEYRHTGGEEQAIANLEDLLRGHHHDVIPYRHASSEWASHSLWRRIPDAAAMLYSFTTVHEIRDRVQKLKPDLAHIHNVFPVISPSVYIALRQLRVPIVQTVHNYRFMCANGLFLTPKGTLCERCKQGNFWTAAAYGCYGESRLRSLPMAATLAIHRRLRTLENSIDRYIAPSQFVVQKLSEAGFPSERISVIPNIAQTTPSAEPRSDSPLFVYAGRLSREKGLWTLLRAFEPLTSIRLVILGEGPLGPVLRDYITQKQLKHIQFEGHIPHRLMPRWLARAWALIMPSECYENMPQAILEAWGCGTPVIVSHLGGLAEMVKNDATARSFPTTDDSTLRQEIQRTVSEGPPSDDCAALCRERLQATHDGERIYSSLMTVYENALCRYK